MSWQMKFLLAFAAIVLGAVLYLKLPPYIAANSSDASATSNISSETASPPSGHDGVRNNVWRTAATCWNRLAEPTTLPVRLKLSFDEKGELATPPEIERDPNTPITDQSLKSEALALQAVSECSPYPMARGLQNVTVPVGLRPIPSSASLPSKGS